MTLSRSSVLHYWSSRYGPLPVIGGSPTHSRNSAGKVADARGIYYDAIVNTPRFSWNTDQSSSANERRAMMLLEQARTNSCLWSRDLTNAAWTSSGGLTAALNAPGLDGTANSATTLTDTDAASTSTRYQSATVSNDNATHVIRVWIAKDAVTARVVGVELDLLGGTTTKTLRVDLNTATGANGASGGGGTSRVLDDGLWWIVEIAMTNNSTGNVTLRWFVYPSVGPSVLAPAASTTGSCVIGNVNVELNQSVGSAPIFTTSAAVTRAVDSFYWNYTPAPQAMMIYARWVERGTLLSSLGLLGIGDLAGNGPRVTLYAASNFYTFLFQNVAAGTNYAVNVAGAPAIGDTMELVAVLPAGGQLLLLSSVNGAAVNANTVASTALTATAWSDAKLQLNQQNNSSAGLNAFADLKVVKYADVVASTNQGIMDELRAFELGPNGDVL